jgi:hypothetical protein
MKLRLRLPVLQCLLFVAVFASGCRQAADVSPGVTLKGILSLRPGMTYPEVVLRIGEPFQMEVELMISGLLPRDVMQSSSCVWITLSILACSISVDGWRTTQHPLSSCAKSSGAKCQGTPHRRQQSFAT